MKIEIIDEFGDDIVRQSILEAIECTYEDLLGKAEWKEPMPECIKEDLVYNLDLLPALKLVFKHYSVHTDHSLLDEYKIEPQTFVSLLDKLHGDEDTLGVDEDNKTHEVDADKIQKVMFPDIKEEDL